MTSQEHSIVANALTIKKQKTVILDALNFTVQAGTITGLIGPSGSGKTTLMRSIVGVQALSSGELTVLGLPAGDKKLRTKIGYVTQSPAVYSDLSVQENIEYFAVLARASKDQVKKVIKQVHLVQQSNRLVEHLSGGQRARVSLAVALLGDPQLLVFDEPTVGLDPILREDLWNLFRELADVGKTLLISSHVMDEADRCDELLLVRDGKILWNNSRQALLDHTKENFVGDAFITMIKGGDNV